MASGITSQHVHSVQQQDMRRMRQHSGQQGGAHIDGSEGARGVGPQDGLQARARHLQPRVALRAAPEHCWVGAGARQRAIAAARGAAARHVSHEAHRACAHAQHDKTASAALQMPDRAPAHHACTAVVGTETADAKPRKGP